MSRVCMLTSVHPPDDPRIYQKQARSLAAAGYDVTLVAPGEARADLPAAPPHGDAAQAGDGVARRAVEPGRTRWSRVTRTTWRVFREALDARADVYHFHDPELIPVGMALRWLGKRVVYDVHEDYPSKLRSMPYLPSAARGLVAGGVGALERWASPFFDGIVCATDAIGRRFRRGVVVRNFPEVERYASTRRSGPFTLIHAGVLSPERGIRRIVDALGPGDSLLLCGRFSPPSFEREITASAGVDYRGYVDPAALPALLAQADVGIVLIQPEPRYRVALPTKMFECMAAGLPVIVSDFPLWRGIVEGADCGLTVDPTDPAAIRAAIRALADDPARRREMGENGRRAVRERYNWAAERATLLELYARLTR